VTNTYNSLIEDAARRLAAALLQAAAVGRASEVTVWAVKTTEQRNGYLHVGFEYPDVALGDATVVRPQSGVHWSALAYTALRPTLWHACRAEPILPLGRTSQ
jgi:hypothetical protein